MAQINLTPGEAFTIIDGRNTVSGSTATGETVTIRGGVTMFTPDFNAGGDRLVFAGSSSQYTIQRSGSSVIIRGPNATEVIFPAPNPNLPEARNPVLAFTAGQEFILDSTSSGIISLNVGGFSSVIGSQPQILGPFIDPPPPMTATNAEMSAVVFDHESAVDLVATVAGQPGSHGGGDAGLVPMIA